MDPSWRTLGEVLLAAFVAVQGWLLRKVWQSKMDRDEVYRLLEDWTRKDVEQDERLVREVTAKLDALVLHQRDEHAENVARLEKLDDKIERLLYAVAGPRGH